MKVANKHRFIKPFYLMVFILTLLFEILLSCAKIPQNVGKTREIIVVSSQPDSVFINETLQRYIFMPQEERVFKFICIPDTAIERYNKFHTLILYGSLDDRFINLLLNEDARAATEKDSFTLFKLNDLWAKGQFVIILAGAKSAYIKPGFLKYNSLIKKLLEENYYQRIKKNYYTKQFDRKIKKALTKFGITLELDKNWMLDSTYQRENFIFVHTHFPDRSIFFYKMPITNEISTSFALKTRNALTRKYYHGDYVLEELTIAERIEFKDMKGLRLKGVWQNDSLVAGGPFLSYFLQKNDSLYIIDAMLFNPGERKSEYFTTLEVILNSLELTPHKEKS